MVKVQLQIEKLSLLLPRFRVDRSTENLLLVITSLTPTDVPNLFIYYFIYTFFH